MDPTSSAAKGFLGSGAFGVGAAWGTGVTCGAGEGIEILSDGIADTAELIPKMSVSGSAQQRAADKGKETHAGDIETEAAFEQCLRPLAYCFGTAGAPAADVSDAAYTHTLKIANNLEGKFLTFVADYGIELHEYPSVKVAKVAFSIANGDVVGKWTYSLICDALIKDGSGANDASGWAAVTIPANRARMLWRNLSFLCNDADGEALGSTDAIAISSISFELGRPLKADDFTSTRGYLIDEPLLDGFTMVRGQIGFSKYTTNNYGLFSDQLAKTKKKMTFTLTSDEYVDGDVPYQQIAYFNDVQFANGQPQIKGAGLTEWTLDFEAHVVASAPNGFDSGYTDAMVLQLVNGVATDPLGGS